MTTLLDGNVLVALSLPAHTHHEAAHSWRTAQHRLRFATCPITQGTLLRIAIRHGASPADAAGLLESLLAQPGHEFWPDDIAYTRVGWAGVVGHRQVTDAYLAQLARHHGGQLATIDSGLAAMHPDVAVLVPVDG